jgi:uncharacterized protein
MRTDLSVSETGRIALPAQGFNGLSSRLQQVRPNCEGSSTGLACSKSTVNVLVRAQYLPLFSRSGSCERREARAGMAVLGGPGCRGTPPRQL